MLNGKYLFLDIGSSETKIVEADVRAKAIFILKTAEMRDTKAYIDNNGIIHNIELYCLSLKKTLKEAGIKSNNAIVCSSIFGIKTRDITEEFKGSIKECTNNFDKHYGRTTNYSVVNDWQHLGNQYLEKTITQKMLMSSGNISLLTSFVETMKLVTGLDVISIESSATALSNLEVLFPHSFDMPSLAIVDLGNDCAHFKVFKENAFVAAVDLKYSEGNIYKALADKFKIVLPKITNITYNVGLDDSDKTASTLAAATLSSSQYFAAIRGYVNTLLKDINEQINYLKNAKNLDDIQVVFTGGVLALPGMASYIEDNFKDHPRRALIVDTKISSKCTKIVNKMNHRLSPKFDTCLGLMLKNHSTHPVNLLPNEFISVDAVDVVGGILRIVRIILLGVIVVILTASTPSILNCITLKEVPQKVQTEEDAVKELQDREVLFREYSQTLTSIDNSLAPLTEFISSCESQDLKIASIDTAGVLNVVIADPEEEIKSVNNIFNGLILRGYATSSDEITNFYTLLKDFKYISSVGMNGIKEVKLSNAETVYIFEMEMSVNDTI